MAHTPSPRRRAVLVAMIAWSSAACAPSSDAPVTGPVATAPRPAVPTPAVPTPAVPTPAGATPAGATPTIPGPTGFTAVGAASVLIEPDAGIAPLYRLLASARSSLDLTMYELADPDAVGVLEADARRGVDVRVVLDRNREGRRNTAAFGQLAAHGVHVRWAPTVYEATHEKAFVVDGRVAVIMTLNLTARYYPDTRDVAVVDTDPADVSAVGSVFDDDYVGRDRGTLPDGRRLVWSPGATGALVDLIDAARHSLLVETEEMTDRAIADALVAAARRGVSVELTTDAGGDGVELGRLRAGGVRVHLSPVDSQRYIHAKVVVVDDAMAWIGSQNFTTTSLRRNRELGVTLRDPRLAAALASTLRGDAAAPG